MQNMSPLKEFQFHLKIALFSEAGILLHKSCLGMSGVPECTNSGTALYESTRNKDQMIKMMNYLYPKYTPTTN